jgi:hypothetical protein
MPWRHKGKWSSTIHNLSTIWRWVVPVLFGYDAWGPQSQFERCGEEKNVVPTRNGTLEVQPIVRHYTNWAILMDNTRQHPSMPPYTRRTKYCKIWWDLSSLDNSVRLMTTEWGGWPENLSSFPVWGRSFVCLQSVHMYVAWAAPSSVGTVGWSGRAVNLIAHLCSMLSLTMHEAIPSFHHTSARK